MKMSELTDNEKVILGAASDLYQIIGADLVSACGLGTEDAYPEDEEVASVLQDRLSDFMRENGYASFVPEWQSFPTSKQLAICRMAL